jgi:hypothetical protein
MHYLANEHWSSRYDSTFFTNRLTGMEILQQSPMLPDGLYGGKSNFPATYFRIEVFCEQKSHICMRRYSQFKWLHSELMSSPPKAAHQEEHQLSLPPGTCPWQGQDEEFLQCRLEALREYLSDVLARPGYARHPAIRVFLELEKFNSI